MILLHFTFSRAACLASSQWYKDTVNHNVWIWSVQHGRMAMHSCQKAIPRLQGRLRTIMHCCYCLYRVNHNRNKSMNSPLLLYAPCQTKTLSIYLNINKGSYVIVIFSLQAETTVCIWTTGTKKPHFVWGMNIWYSRYEHMTVNNLKYKNKK